MQTAFARKTLQELLGLEISHCRCGQMHRVPTREVALHSGALNRLPAMAARWFSERPLIMAVDANTWKAAGQAAERLLENGGFDVTVHFVDRRSSRVHADKDAVTDLAARIDNTGAAAVVATGSGTISDICKSAATLAGKPLITVATAASMNGYTSAISALTAGGLKITEPCNPPVAIIADPEILATAPLAMSAAGFGDLLSKNASTADWLMAHVLLGEYFCEIPVAVAEEAVKNCIERAAIIRANRPEGLSVLIEALLRSGIAMVLAGSSAPASGGEHLISHLWDMTAHWTGRTPALHGQQTGVTTLISLALYRKILALEPGAIRLGAIEPEFESLAALETGLRKVFREIAESVMPHARQKFLAGPDLERRRRLIVRRWDAIREAVSAVVIPPAQSRRHLQSAGAVYRVSDLGVSAAELDFALTYSRWIRSRYTVIDLAAEIGMLDQWRDEILEEV